ncbi:FAD-dependent oxidoreductase [Desulfosporosinus sp. SB140]|uniref:FAD-dependent oxidoreductase n=1 Tax=Desulfosporosinus paludis TaxID=3115649 RepID=UPI00388EB5B1
MSLTKGVLKCQKLVLEKPNASGRRNPILKEGEFEEISVDTVISAIGETVNHEVFEKNGIAVDEKGNVMVDPDTFETNVRNVYVGGDALYGPATVVLGIAHATKVAKAILAKESLPWEKDLADIISFENFNEDRRLKDIIVKKGVLRDGCREEEENERCLECHRICDICAEVCPNRANIDVKIEGLGNLNQIVHVDGICNECGNCATFCPYDSAHIR